RLPDRKPSWFGCRWKKKERWPSSAIGHAPLPRKQIPSGGCARGNTKNTTDNHSSHCSSVRLSGDLQKVLGHGKIAYCKKGWNGFKTARVARKRNSLLFPHFHQSLNHGWHSPRWISRICCGWCPLQLYSDRWRRSACGSHLLHFPFRG